MAYKFQLGAAILSGSLTQEGEVLAKDSALSGSSLSIAGTAVTATSAELNYLDGADANINTLSLPASTTITSFAASILDDVDEASFKATVNLEIGTDVQAQDAGLQYLADLTITDEATFQEQVGLEIGVDVQAYDADLDNLSGMQAGASAALALLTSTEVAILDGATVSTAELNLLDDITRGSLIYGNSSGASAELAAGSANTVLASDGTDIGYFQIDNAMIDASAGIELSKLESVSSANIIVGNGSNVATAVAMSGDVAIDNTGATTIQANAVEGSMINSNAAGAGLDYSANALNVAVSGALKVASDKVSITGSFAGPGLAYEGGVDSISKVSLNFSSLAVEETNAANLGSTDLFSYYDTADSTQRKVAVPVVRDRIYSDVSGDATIAAGGALTIAAGAVENGMLAGSITANKMNNAIFEDLETLGAPASDGQFIVATGAGAFAYESGATARTSLGLGASDNVDFNSLTLAGDLTVRGSLTYVDTTNLAISDALITIGSGSSAFAVDYGLEFGAVGSGWASIKTANEDLSGAGSEGIFKFSHAISGSTVAATSMIAGTFYGNLEGSVKESVQSINSTSTISLANGSQVLADASGGAITLTLPSAADCDGLVLKIKKQEGSANVVTISAPAGSIDGESSIALESPYAAVNIISDGTDYYIV